MCYWNSVAFYIPKTVLADSLEPPQRLNEILIAKLCCCYRLCTHIAFKIILLVKIDQMTLTFYLFGWVPS